MRGRESGPVLRTYLHVLILHVISGSGAADLLDPGSDTIGSTVAWVRLIMAGAGVFGGKSGFISRNSGPKREARFWRDSWVILIPEVSGRENQGRPCLRS